MWHRNFYRCLKQQIFCCSLINGLLGNWKLVTCTRVHKVEQSTDRATAVQLLPPAGGEAAPIHLRLPLPWKHQHAQRSVDESAAICAPTASAAQIRSYRVHGPNRPHQYSCAQSQMICMIPALSSSTISLTLTSYSKLTGRQITVSHTVLTFWHTCSDVLVVHSSFN